MFVKTLDKSGARFLYLKEKTPLLSYSKIKEGIFVGPKISALIRDGKLEDVCQTEKSSWKSYEIVKPQLP
jgi:hypothetical protein